MPKNSSGKKKIIIALSIVFGLLILYFPGIYGGGLIALQVIFGRRFDGDDYAKARQTILKVRDDYPSLQNSEDVYFFSGENKLAGHINKAIDSKGTVVVVHGINGSSKDDTSALQDYFLNRGYDIFAFDLTVSGDSEGSGVKGLYQSALDVCSAVDYLSSRKDLDLNRLAFVGYSWGAYGVASSLELNLKAKPKAVCAISGFVNPKTAMLSSARKYVGVLADITRPQFDWAMATRCGEYASLSALSAIESHPEVDWTIVHGGQDDTVSLDASLYQAVKGKGLDAHTYLREDYPHLGIWRTKEANQTYNDAMEYYKSIEKHKNAFELLQEYVQSNGIKDKASNLDQVFMDQLESNIAASLNK